MPHPESQEVGIQKEEHPETIADVSQPIKMEIDGINIPDISDLKDDDEITFTVAEWNKIQKEFNDMVFNKEIMLAENKRLKSKLKILFQSFKGFYDSESHMPMKWFRKKKEMLDKMFNEIKPYIIQLQGETARELAKEKRNKKHD